MMHAGGEIIVNETTGDAYMHGKGAITVKAKIHIEDSATSKKKLSAKPLIVITELPYQTNKARVQQKTTVPESLVCLLDNIICA
jgi:DNA gyrase subunit A